MKSCTRLSTSKFVLLGAVALLGAALAWPLLGTAGDKQPTQPTKHKHGGKPAEADKDLSAQVSELQAKIARLEAALKQGHKGTPSGSPNAGGMAGMPMGMMGDKKMSKGMM